MAILPLPHSRQKEDLAAKFSNELMSYVTVNSETQELKGNVCAVCDSMQKEAFDMELVPINKFREMCRKCNLHRERVRSFYKNTEQILENYRLRDIPELDEFILSPRTLVVDRHVMCCSSCFQEMKTRNQRKSSAKRVPPKDAIANFYLQGTPPEELTCLNEVELAIVNRIRIFSQTYVIYGGCHQQITGWHCFLRNRHESSIANLQQLSADGLNNTILVVMVGPFTPRQKVLAKKRFRVRTDKVVAAFKWLKENNIYYKDDQIPSEDELPVPHVVFEDGREVASVDPNIENEMTSTVLFPDNSLPEPYDG